MNKPVAPYVLFIASGVFMLAAIMLAIFVPEPNGIMITGPVGLGVLYLGLGIIVTGQRKKEKTQSIEKKKAVNKTLSIIFIISGIAILIIQAAARNFVSEAGAIPELIFYGSSLLGMGLLGGGTGGLIFYNSKKSKQAQINEKDERNILIREKAGYITWYITCIILGVMLYVFSVTDNTTGLLLTFGAILIHFVSPFIIKWYFKKKM